MQLKEEPVFYDQSGKRWRITENIITLFVVLVGLALYWFVPRIFAMHHPPSLASPSKSSTASVKNASTRDSEPTVQELMKILAAKNVEVIGAGPLVRLIKVEKSSNETFASDPFTSASFQKLTSQEIRLIGSDDYAIQRYGSAREKRISLTFDDGPDAVYTPRLLDILSQESVPATFFVTGDNVAKHPEIMKRLIAEGHAVGNHTFSHVDFDFVGGLRGEQEINQTQRLILATTNQDTAFFRPPYGGNTDQSYRNSLKGILTAQKSGYTVASYDFDTDDWRFPSGYKPKYPVLDGSNTVLLLHDSGGDRSRTISYVRELIHVAKSKGYTFATLKDLYPVASGRPPVVSTPADHVSLMATQAVLVWPQHLIMWLFIFSLATLVVISLFNILLALWYKATSKNRIRSKKFTPHVSIIVPAYNEDKVIEKSVRSLIRSRYRKIEILIVDDGSTDNTWQVARALARRYKRVKALHQTNSGKAVALNNAIARTESDIVICVDADTLFPPDTIKNLVRHFEDETVGAVAGVVKVGNAHGVLTKWQALEYISGISIERNAQALLGAITIVPGACGAWRRSILMEVGGFSSSTLAEDCDLALKIQKTKRYRILQDNEAISYTEAPQSLMALTKQRFRWTFGNIQSLWKHRHMVLNGDYGWLGLYVMPSAIIAIAVPILFWPLLIAVTVENVMSGNYQVILLFFVLSLVVQFFISAIGVALARERYSLLWAVPFARFTYGPIRMYILYKTVLTILKGVDVGWNKLARTGTAYDPFGAKLTMTPARSRKT